MRSFELLVPGGWHRGVAKVKGPASDGPVARGEARSAGKNKENESADVLRPAVTEISVHTQLSLGHLRYQNTDVSLQPNSPTDTVLRTIQSLVRTVF